MEEPNEDRKTNHRIRENIKTRKTRLNESTDGRKKILQTNEQNKTQRKNIFGLTEFKGDISYTMKEEK